MLTHCSISCSSSGRITRLVANGVFLFLFFYISFIFDLSTLVPFALLPLRVRMNEIVSFPVADCVSHPIKTHTSVLLRATKSQERGCIRPHSWEDLLPRPIIMFLIITMPCLQIWTLQWAHPTASACHPTTCHPSARSTALPWWVRTIYFIFLQ